MNLQSYCNAYMTIFHLTIEWKLMDIRCYTHCEKHKYATPYLQFDLDQGTKFRARGYPTDDTNDNMYEATLFNSRAACSRLLPG